MPANLSNLSTKRKANDGVKMIVKHPETGEPILDEATNQPVTITLVGSDSDEYKKIQHAQQNERLKKATRDGRLKVTAEAIEHDALDLLVRCTKGWEGIALDSDEQGDIIPLKFNPDNVRRLYETIAFVRDQAADFISDRLNFLGN